MTTDIEARLREYTSGDLIAADGFVGGDVLGTLREAADTIAALKAKLERVMTEHELWRGNYGLAVATSDHLRAQLAEAMEALRPFAHLNEIFPMHISNMGPVTSADADGDHDLMVGDLRRAAEVLRKMEKGNG